MINLMKAAESYNFDQYSCDGCQNLSLNLFFFLLTTNKISDSVYCDYRGRTVRFLNKFLHPVIILIIFLLILKILKICKVPPK